MKIIVAGAISKFFHLKEFVKALEKYDITCKLVHDVDVVDGFPSRRVKNWLPKNDKFDELVRGFKPDLVVVDRQRHFGLAAKKRNLPLLVMLRGDFWSEIKWAKETIYKSFPKNIAINMWERIGEECFKGSAAILPICRYLEKIVNERYPTKPTAVIQSGINPDRWFQSSGMQLKHPCVGLLQGAVIWGKTQEMLTLRKVIVSHPDVTFYWAGDGPYRQEILSALGKHDNFKWLGPLQYPDKVREYLSEVDIYALFSGIDMSPLTIQEASLMKKPVIATNVGGIPELMINNKTGFLVSKGNSNEWIERISLLINDQSMRDQMGNAGNRFVSEHFSWDKIAKNFVDFVNTTKFT